MIACLNLGVSLVVALGLSLPGCTGSADLAASSPGDYDPRTPPRTLDLKGDLEVHDPTLFRDPAGYHVFYSGDGLLTKTSTDLHTFQNGSPVFSKNPAWIQEQVPDATALWSPTVAPIGGKLHLYYAASVFGTERSCVGHAIANTVSSGFEDQGSVVCSNVTNVKDDFNAIDPALFVDDDGSPWLSFGSFGSGIKLLALDAEGNRLNQKLYSVAARSTENPAIQASFLMKRASYYYLFVSFDTCCQGADSTHNLRVGRAEQVTGPYVDRDGVPLLEGGGTLLLEGGTRWRGPGSNMVYVEGEKRYNVYHAYDAQAKGMATLRLAELEFDNDGWPLSAGP